MPETKGSRYSIEKEIGREVIGIMRGGDVSWQFGRKLGLGI